VRVINIEIHNIIVFLGKLLAGYRLFRRSGNGFEWTATAVLTEPKNNGGNST